MSEVRTGRRSTDNPRLLRPRGHWQQYKGGVYRCMVFLTAKEAGSFSVVAAHLPGVAGRGSSEREALANVVEAFASAIRLYRDRGVGVPWMKTPVDHERGALERWVIVRA